MFLNQTGTRLSFVDAAIAVVAQNRADGLLLNFDEEFRKIPNLHLVEPVKE